MPAELVSRIDIDKLYPPYLEALLNTLANCQKRGVSYYALSGYRSIAEQQRLYFQGRTLPGKKVTNARGGFSTHNWGIAVDVCFDADNLSPGLTPGWNAKDYAVLAEEGQKLGLQVGVQGLADYGHTQVPLIARLKRKEADVLGELKKIMEAPGGSLKAVWAHLDDLGLDLLTPPGD